MLGVLSATPLAWSQTDPTFAFSAELLAWPDVQNVFPAYGNITVVVSANGSLTDQQGNSYKANVLLTRYQSIGATSTVNYTLSGTLSWAIVYKSISTNPADSSSCTLTTMASVSAADSGSPFDQGELLPFTGLTVTNQLNIAHLTVNTMGHHGFNYQISDNGCNALGGAAGYYSDDPIDLHIAGTDPRAGTIASLLATFGITQGRIPFYSSLNTLFSQAALIAESSGEDTGGPLDSTGAGGLIESAWIGNRTSGSYTTQLIDGITVPNYNLDNLLDPGGFSGLFGNLAWPGSMTVSWSLSGTAPPAPVVDNEVDSPCDDDSGSIVGCQNQTLGESLPVTGTSYSLHYSSDRVAGSTSANAVAVTDALQLGGWTLSVHHAFDPSLQTYCVGGACSPPSSEPKALFLGDGTTRSDAKIQAPVQAGGNYYLTSQNGREVYVFNSKGQHLQTLRPMTGAVAYTFGYDAAGSLISVTDAAGNVTKIDRDPSEHPLDIVAPFGQKTTLAVDANGYLSRIADPAGNQVILTNGTSGLLTRMTDANGGVFTFQYDSSGLLLHDNDPVGGSINLSRTTTNGNYTVTKTSALQRTTTYSTAFAAQAGTSTAQTLGVAFPAGQQSAQTETQMSGQLAQTTTLPDGSQYQYTLGPDPRFGIQAPVGASAAVTRGKLTRNSVGNRTAVTSGTGPFNLTSQTDTLTVNGRVYTSKFTTSNGTYGNVSPEGRTVLTTLDSLERVSGHQVGSLLPIAFTYDSNGRPASITQSGRTTAFGYDHNGWLSSMTTPVGQQTFTHDAAGNLASFNRADGQTAGFTHDANRNLTSVTPPGETAHLYTYTPVNLLASYTPPEVPGAGPTTYSYDADRQLTSVALPDGQNIDYTYDNFGRLTSRRIQESARRTARPSRPVGHLDAAATVRNPTQTIDYTYDPATGNLVTAAISGGETVDWTYAGGLITSEAWSGPVAGTVARTYDNNFWKTALTINRGSPLNFAYDLDGLVTTAGALAIQRTADTGLVSQTTLGATSDSWTYDGYGELTGYSAQAGGATVYSSQLTYNSLGQITGKTESIGGKTNSFTYTYDAAWRLATVSQNGAVIGRYSYDANSNWLTGTSASGTVSGTYDAQDRMLSLGNSTFTYGANGELAGQSTAGQNSSYTYDAVGNLIAATAADGTALAYLVDARGRRVGVTVNGSQSAGFLYDGNRIVAQLDGANSLVSQFVYATRRNAPDYFVKNGVTYRIFSDILGSPRLVVNAATGAVVEQIDYSVTGEIVNDTNPGFQPFGFAGGLYDPHTKLVRFGARDYMPAAGRWTAKDPLRFAGGDTNLYAYALNDPVNRMDPRGLATKTVDGHFGYSDPVNSIDPPSPDTDDPPGDEPDEEPCDPTGTLPTKMYSPDILIIDLLDPIIDLTGVPVSDDLAWLAQWLQKQNDLLNQPFTGPTPCAPCSSGGSGS